MPSNSRPNPARFGALAVVHKLGRIPPPRRRRFPSLASLTPTALLIVLVLGTVKTALWADGNDDPDMPSAYWRLPLVPQGEPPATWSDLEKSLVPQHCGMCHPAQYEQWRGSLHAQAFSLGLVGQLLNYDAADTAACMQCHAPLAEQRDAFEAARAQGQAHLTEAQGLAAAGNSCAGCHLRNRRRFGPPQRDTGATGQSQTTVHGGVLRTAYFESSAFCGTCHQFPQEQAINGKPLENTYVEWQGSPQAAQGITCQNCHMPDRQHLWRGIHDPEMVKTGLTARFTTDDQGARFELTNTGVGHAFPTYVTPKAVMHAVALDEAGRPQPQTLVSHVIQRRVGHDGQQWIEHADTRLLPERTARLFLAWPDSGRVRMWLEIHPDDFYDHQVYGPLKARLAADTPAAKLITRAADNAADNQYRLFETDLRRPRGGLDNLQGHEEKTETIGM